MNTAIQTLIMIGSLGAMMWGMMKFLLKDIHKDLENINKRLDKSESRIDHLYQICIEMLKARGS